MASTPVPERTMWAVERLELAPTDRLLEIGCGRGTAVMVICERLEGGSILAIDRSPTMVRMAAERNAAQVTAGKAEFQVAEFRTADLAGRRFNRILAVNVNLFWVRTAAVELALVQEILAPGGTLHLCYEVPAAARAAAIQQRLRDALTGHGFSATFTTGATRRNSLLAVAARPVS